MLKIPYSVDSEGATWPWSRGITTSHLFDNRCLVHAATWFDAENEGRLMWRTTVSGNPGAIYAGEKKSWIAA
jgi:hypothetical protein